MKPELIQKYAALWQEAINSDPYHIEAADMQGKGVLDIGANVGLFSITAAEMGASKVLAVEPMPDTFKELCENVAEYPTILPIQGAIMNGFGTVNMAGEGIRAHVGQGPISVPTYPLSHFVDSLGVDPTLKIDCEGAEYDILFNASGDTIRRFKTIMMEIHWGRHNEMHPDAKRYNSATITNYLHILGFETVSQVPYFMFYANGQGQIVSQESMDVEVVKMVRRD